MEKFLYSLLFLVSAAITYWLGNKLVSTANKAEKNKGFLRTTIISIAILTFYIIQYCILIHQPFPFVIYFVLIGVILAVQIINSVLGAATGLTIDETFEKIQILSSFTVFRNMVTDKIKLMLMGLLSILIFGSTIWALVLFARNPLGDPETRVWLAMAVFGLPLMIGVLLIALLFLPSMTSAYLDNDLRNYYLFTNLTNILANITYLIFPYSMIYPDMALKFPGFPSFTIIALGFMVFTMALWIIPYFIGEFKYKNQRKFFLNYRKTMLEKITAILSIHNRENYRGPLNTVLNELEPEILKRENKSKSIEAFTLLNDPELLKGDPQTKVLAQDLIEHTTAIQGWDKELSHLIKLREIRDNLQSDDFTTLQNYVSINLAAVNTKITEFSKSAKKNFVGGILSFIIIGVITGLLNQFGSKIFDFIVLHIQH